VVIPTYNSSPTLETCLKSVRLQTYPNIEIIVVDNCSTDESVDIAKKYGSIIFRVKALRSMARNYGAAKARGDFIIFIDADMELTPKVIEESIRKALNDNADAIMIPEIRVGESFWAKCRAVERLTYVGDPLIESARFFRKEVFEKVDEYDERLEAGEDWDLHARVDGAGYKIKSIGALIRHYEGQLTLRRMVLKRYYYGKTLMKYIRKHPKNARIQFMPIRLNYIRNWRILAREPLYGCGVLFMKMLEYVVTAAAMVSMLLSTQPDNRVKKLD
jgi:glycosyltransferase involved in cell wall biosynthesis